MLLCPKPSARMRRQPRLMCHHVHRPPAPGSATQRNVAPCNNNVELRAHLEELCPGQSIDMAQVQRLAAQMPSSARLSGPSLAAAMTAPKHKTANIRMAAMLSVPMDEIGLDRMQEILADLSGH